MNVNVQMIDDAGEEKKDTQRLHKYYILLRIEEWMKNRNEKKMKIIISR